jgi:glycosyltransferase involved in cell wall biosynthesis
MQFTSRRFFGVLLGLAARFDLPWLAARALHLIVRPLNTNRTATLAQPRYRLLILNSGKDEFFQDIEASFPEGSDFEPVYWPSYALGCIADEILAPSLRHNNYITTNPDAEQSKLRYRSFLKRLWKHHQAAYRIDAVIGANFGYRIQREFATALESAGTPFIVVQKENLNASGPARRAVWHRIYKEKRGPFGGRKILVYNDIERDLEVSSGIIDAQNVVVTGMPRLDKLHQWRRDNAGPAKNIGTPQVLFFAFARNEKLPQVQQVGSDVVGRDWGSFWEQTHRAILALARENPDIRIVVKTKGNARQDAATYQTLQSGELPANLKIVSGGDARDLITESHVVIGFNTTGLLEAIAIGKPVITPRFGEACDETMREFILDLGDAVDYADSPQQIVEKACTYARKPPETPLTLSGQVARTLKYWLGNDDGKAGQRVLDVVRIEISNGTHADKVAHDKVKRLSPSQTRE